MTSEPRRSAFQSPRSSQEASGSSNVSPTTAPTFYSPEDRRIGGVGLDAYHGQAQGAVGVKGFFASSNPFITEGDDGIKHVSLSALNRTSVPDLTSSLLITATGTHDISPLRSSYMTPQRQRLLPRQYSPTEFVPESVSQKVSRRVTRTVAVKNFDNADIDENLIKDIVRKTSMIAKTNITCGDFQNGLALSFRSAMDARRVHDELQHRGLDAAFLSESGYDEAVSPVRRNNGIAHGSQSICVQVQPYGDLALGLNDQHTRDNFLAHVAEVLGSYTRGNIIETDVLREEGNMRLQVEFEYDTSQERQEAVRAFMLQGDIPGTIIFKGFDVVLLQFPGIPDRAFRSDSVMEPLNQCQEHRLGNLMQPQERYQPQYHQNRRDQYPRAHHDRQADKGQPVDIATILRGTDVRTTIMLRNIPNKVTNEELKEMLDEHSFGKYDFMYLRIDFAANSNVGYAFINFVTAQDIIPLVEARQGKLWMKYKSAKVAQVNYATVQGRENLVERFRNSSVMDEYPMYRPKLYYTLEHDLAGQEEPFPAPDNITKLQRSRNNAQFVGLFPPKRTIGYNPRVQQSMYDRGTPQMLAEQQQLQDGRYGNGHGYNRAFQPQLHDRPFDQHQAFNMGSMSSTLPDLTPRLTAPVPSPIGSRTAYYPPVQALTGVEYRPTPVQAHTGNNQSATTSDYNCHFQGGAPPYHNPNSIGYPAAYHPMVHDTNRGAYHMGPDGGPHYQATRML